MPLMFPGGSISVYQTLIGDGAPHYTVNPGLNGYVEVLR